MTKHLSARRIALHAGGELSWWEKFAVGRHLRGCERCREELRGYREQRESMRDESAVLPQGLNWERLAAEMKANIHLGLEAGEIAAGRLSSVAVDGDQDAQDSFGSFLKPVGALASVAIFLYGATWVLSTQPKREAAPANQILLTTTADGIEYQAHGSALKLIHSGSKPVALKVGSVAGLRAQYVDEDTGQVTIHHVFSE